MKKILVLTGKRGGFGAMKQMLRYFRDDPDVELQLVVTDQHVNSYFGFTSSEVIQEFTITSSVDMQQSGDTYFDRARALGTCLSSMVDVFNKLKPDICVLYGDRGEVLASAVAATAIGIPIAHLQGGDVSGSVDDQMRHAITKLAHLHFPSTKESAERIIAMGEESWRVEVVGDHHLDLICAGEYASKGYVADKLNLDPEQPIVIVLQHSETTAPHESYQQMIETLIAVRDLDLQTVVVYPCSDVGYMGIVRAIGELATGSRFRVHVNLEAPVFWGLMAISDVFVGNSSAGIVESPSFSLPTVNLGRRQEGRLHAQNVIHAPHNRVEIRTALNTALYDPVFLELAANCDQPYGDGKAGERVVRALKNVTLNKNLITKKMTY